MSENINNLGWFASVKYVIDQKREYVPITDITVIGPGSLKTPFVPKHLNDYTPGRIYCVKTKTSSKDGKAHPYNAVIGRLAESREAMKLDKNRTVWPTITQQMQDCSEPESSAAEEDPNRKRGLSTNRNMNKTALVLKRRAQAKELENLANFDFFALEKEQPLSLQGIRKSPASSLPQLHCNPRSDCSTNFDIPSTANRSSTDSLTNFDTSSTSNCSLTDFPPDQDTVEAMAIKIKWLEDQLQKERADKASSSNDHIGKLIEEKLKTYANVFETRMEAMEEKVTSLAGILKEPKVTSSTASGVSSDPDIKVDIGGGIMMSQAYLASMNAVMDDHASWANLLLRGVFGERTKNMRVNSGQTSDIEKFDPNFLTIAKCMYREWLNKMSVTLDGVSRPKYTHFEAEGLVSKLPKYLAERATDMKGPRGKNRLIREAKEANLPPPFSRPPRIPGTSPGTKRPYLRKGEKRSLVVQASTTGNTASTPRPQVNQTQATPVPPPPASQRSLSPEFSAAGTSSDSSVVDVLTTEDTSLTQLRTVPFSNY